MVDSFMFNAVLAVFQSYDGAYLLQSSVVNFVIE